MELNLSQKSIIITGGSSGIGLTMVNRFLKQGASVVVIDKNMQVASGIEKKYNTDAEKVKFFQADLCNKHQVAEAFHKAADFLKTVDVLVNNAGDMLAGSFMEITEEQWDYMLTINVKSLFYTCKQIIPIFMRQGRGNIINMSSIFGMRGTSEFACYSMTKAAVISLTQSLAGELARSGIRVNCISPGIIMTPMITKVKHFSGTEFGQESIENYLSGCFPLTDSLGDPNDVASMVLFLASDHSQWITGNNIEVDGGYFSESGFTKFRRIHEKKLEA